MFFSETNSWQIERGSTDGEEAGTGKEVRGRERTTGKYGASQENAKERYLLHPSMCLFPELAAFRLLFPRSWHVKLPEWI